MVLYNDFAYVHHIDGLTHDHSLVTPLFDDARSKRGTIGSD